MFTFRIHYTRLGVFSSFSVNSLNYLRNGDQCSETVSFNVSAAFLKYRRRGSNPHMELPIPDFESGASAIPPLRRYFCRCMFAYAGRGTTRCEFSSQGARPLRSSESWCEILKIAANHKSCPHSTPTGQPRTAVTAGNPESCSSAPCRGCSSLACHNRHNHFQTGIRCR